MFLFTVFAGQRFAGIRSNAEEQAVVSNVGQKLSKGLSFCVSRYTGYHWLSYWLTRAFLTPASDALDDQLRYERQRTAVNMLAAVVIIGIWGVLLVFAANMVLSGMKAGVLASLLGFLITLALLLTIIVQRMELKVALDELQHNRKEMVRSVKALEHGAKACAARVSVDRHLQMDSMFFSLLTEHNRLLGQLNQPSELLLAPNQLHPAAYMFHRLHHYPLSNRETLLRQLDAAALSCETLPQAAACTAFYRHHIHPWCLLLGQLLLFIYRSRHPDTGRPLNLRQVASEEAASSERRYADIVRAMLPEEALRLAAIACSHAEQSQESRQLRALIVRYKLLEHLELKAGDAWHPALLALLDQYMVWKSPGEPVSAFGHSLAVERYFIEACDPQRPLKQLPPVDFMPELCRPHIEEERRALGMSPHPSAHAER